jgi:putrescine transport system permease protein
MSARAGGKRWEGLAVLVPYLWLLLFFLAPFAIILKISFADPVIASPPFSRLIERAADGAAHLHATLDNYRYLFQDRLYVLTYLSSVKLAAISTLLCLLVGYPMAYAIARARSTVRTLLLLFVILPFWISFLLRVYAWVGILSTHGLLNRLLLHFGWIDAPLQIMYTNTAVYIGIVYSYLPFMILPLYANLERMDLDLRAAAADLGARPWQVFVDITLPLSMPGIIAGSLLVFIPAMGEYVIPALLGGDSTLMIGRVVFDEFFANRDWPVAAAVTVVLLLILVVPMMWFQHVQAAERSG